MTRCDGRLKPLITRIVRDAFTSPPQYRPQERDSGWGLSNCLNCQGILDYEVADASGAHGVWSRRVAFSHTRIRGCAFPVWVSNGVPKSQQPRTQNPAPETQNPEPRTIPYRFRPYDSWEETQSEEEMAEPRLSSPASATLATISANLFTFPFP